ncbi:HAD family hydrolase [Acuticoccus sp. MNP-M23]|uniref:HAD family hydrolase n=1 Tax=Acuticoccus sp. MNP-M23 TaxID=3072793 RepID=UPI0028155F81|nr:HAD family hydrolase [Acuticoccus sp. MNP-M23]WMS43798.1 HAD family hydrolase [Acuticoccus sp. MNP-M23]
MAFQLSAMRAIAAAAVLAFSFPALAADDPLPSWNDGPNKQAILEFVGAVTTDGGPDYVAPEDRVATFDNDGTLWSEQPMYVQLQFALDRVKALAPQHPEWKTTEPFKSVLAGDVAGIAASGKKGVLEIIGATHSGMTTDEFASIVSDWIKTAKNPKTGKLATEMIFQPMLELVNYLKDNEFEVFIVSGGGIAFMRPWTEAVYGIGPRNVVGSSVKLKYVAGDAGPSLQRLDAVDFVDDGPGKPVGIQNHIGKRPIAAFGNSDGDFEMLAWTTGGEGRRLGMIVHHDDAAREFAYDRDSHFGKLSKALDAAPTEGWHLISMKNDWTKVFPAE